MKKISYEDLGKLIGSKLEDYTGSWKSKETSDYEDVIRKSEYNGNMLTWNNTEYLECNIEISVSNLPPFTFTFYEKEIEIGNNIDIEYYI